MTKVSHPEGVGVQLNVEWTMRTVENETDDSTYPETQNARYILRQS